MEVVDSFKEYLCFERHASPLTIKSYSEDIAALVQFLDCTPIEECTTSDIRAMLMVEVERGRNPRSINRRISSLRTLFNFLIKRGVVSKNPLAKIKSLRSDSRLPNFITLGELSPIIEELEADTICSELTPQSYTTVLEATVILVLYFTGLRRAELESLSLGSLDLDNQTLKVVGKGQKERVVPINSKLKTILERYMQKRDEISCNLQRNSLFLRYNKTEELIPLKAADIYGIVKSKLSSIGTKARVSPHTLRHTFATHLLSSGVGIRSIQELLGHSSIASTQIYSHNTIEALKECHSAAHPRANLQNNKVD